MPGLTFAAMRALWLADRAISLRNVPDPVRPDGEAGLRVLQAGICNTDLELVRGYYPYDGILGHEFVGLVEQGPAELVGRRVVGGINAVCGECVHCRAGRPTHCANRTVLGIVNRPGVFAERVSLPVENLHPVPDHVSTDAATFAEPLAAALEITEQVPIGTATSVLVVGDGKLGQLIARVLARTGCELTVVGKHRSKLERLDGIASRTVLAGQSLQPEFDVAVECTGDPRGFDAARAAVRPRGTLVMKSTYAGTLEIDASAVVVDEITLVGSRCGPMDRAVDLLDRGEIEVESLISARYSLENAVEAFDHAARSGVLKVLLDVSDPPWRPPARARPPKINAD